MNKALWISAGLLLLPLPALAEALTPQVFEPDVISLDGPPEWAFAFSPDGNTLLVQRWADYRLDVSHLVEGKWTERNPGPSMNWGPGTLTRFFARRQDTVRFIHLSLPM